MGDPFLFYRKMRPMRKNAMRDRIAVGENKEGG